MIHLHHYHVYTRFLQIRMLSHLSFFVTIILSPWTQHFLLRFYGVGFIFCNNNFVKLLRIRPKEVFLLNVIMQLKWDWSHVYLYHMLKIKILWANILLSQFPLKCIIYQQRSKFHFFRQNIFILTHFFIYLPPTILSY